MHHMDTNKMLDGNKTRMLQVILHLSSNQHSIKQQMYGPLSLILLTIRVRQTRYAEYCYIVIYTFMQHHNDTTLKTKEGGRRKEDAKRLL